MTSKEIAQENKNIEGWNSKIAELHVFLKHCRIAECEAVLSKIRAYQYKITVAEDRINRSQNRSHKGNLMDTYFNN